jgi:dephospho-CoA kinase
MPKIIGLTGGIGSGKTKVTARFLELGIPCYIADDEAKKLMKTSTAIRDAVINEFGEASYENNRLNTTYLAAIVFNDSNKLSKLNAIVHPEVAKDFETWVATHKTLYVIKEAAILFENGGFEKCNETILVTAPKDIRMKRVLARDKSSVEAIEQRMSRQWSDDKKKPLASYVIENIDWEKTLIQIDAIHEKLI